MAKELLPDALWARIAPLLPRCSRRSRRSPRADFPGCRIGLTSIWHSCSLAAWLRPHLPAFPDGYPYLDDRSGACYSSTITLREN